MMRHLHNWREYGIITPETRGGTNTMEHYLDNAATTKPCAEAAEAVVRCMTEQYGNPSSLHRKGLEAQHVMEHAYAINVGGYGPVVQA